MAKPGLIETLRKRIKLLLGTSRATADARALLAGDDEVKVDQSDDIVIRPRNSSPTKGIIFYPGGRCESEAYLPLMCELARDGYLCVIACPPLHVAAFSPDRAAAIMLTYPEITNWTLGGHSLGGAFACRFASLNADTLSGLFLLGSYPSDSHDLSHCQFPVTLFYGTEDTFALPERILAARKVVPDHTDFIAIEGGDHYQFGAFENCERTATISAADQYRQVADLLKSKLAS